MVGNRIGSAPAARIRSAIARQCAAQRTLGEYAGRCLEVPESSQSLPQFASVLAAFDHERALPRRGQALLGLEHRSDSRRETEPLEPRCGEHDRLEFSPIELREPRVEIAAQRIHHQLRMALAQLRLAPQAGSSNDASRRQRFEARAQVRYKAVARVLSRGDRRQAKALGQTHRYVLRRVHGKIGPPVLERGLEFLDEKALAADLGERPIDDLVASRRDAEDAHLAMRIQALELAGDMLGLPHREPAPARRNDDSFRTLTQLLFPSSPAT